MYQLSIMAIIVALLSSCAGMDTQTSTPLRVTKWHYLTEEQMPAVIGECEHIKTRDALSVRKDKETGESKRVLHWYLTMVSISYTRGNTIVQVCGDDGNAIRGEFYYCEGITFTEADLYKGNKRNKLCP